MKPLIYEQIKGIYILVLKKGLNIKLNELNEVVLWNNNHHITILGVEK